jgi:LmbE family N-acetylglucosaminyl deacetylase
MQEISIERSRSDRPNAGKVFVAVHAHASDVPFFASGLCAKLTAEGSTGYLIRTTNDETSGGKSTAQNILSNETEHAAMAKALGFKDVFELYYRSHRMNEISPVELRGRLVLLFRFLNVETVLSYHTSSDDEPDSDRWITGRAVEEACWTAGSKNDFHEHEEAGVLPHFVRERYYFHVHPGQPFNRIVDITAQLDQKIDAIVECRSQGAGSAGSLLRAQLAKEGRRLPLLGDDDRTADRAYVRQFLLQDFRHYARGHDFEYAERFEHRGTADLSAAIKEYIDKNAVKL